MIELDIRQKLRAKDLWEKLSKPSPVRFASFLADSNDEHIDALALYAWNVALCTHLLPVLSATEVLLRNGIHTSLKRHYGQEDWWEHARLNLLTAQNNQIDAALRDLRDDGNNNPTPDEMVASLSFSFWTSLLTHRYEQTVYTHLVSNGMPHLPPENRSRSDVHSRFDEIRKLRNRAFHNKPIYKNKADLVAIYNRALEATGWFNKTYHAFVKATSTFPKVANDGPSMYRDHLITAFKDDIGYDPPTLAK